MSIRDSHHGIVTLTYNDKVRGRPKQGGLNQVVVHVGVYTPGCSNVYMDATAVPPRTNHVSTSVSGGVLNDVS